MRSTIQFQKTKKNVECWKANAHGLLSASSNWACKSQVWALHWTAQKCNSLTRILLSRLLYVRCSFVSSATLIWHKNHLIRYLNERKPKGERTNSNTCWDGPNMRKIGNETNNSNGIVTMLIWIRGTWAQECVFISLENNKNGSRTQHTCATL